MATAEVPDTTASTLLCLQPEKRRKILLETLREGYPCKPKVSRPVSSKVSRYVSQFTSGRWREKIWFSDDSNEDMQCEASTPESEAPPQLFILGYDLHSDDFLKEREMIARWNIVERELHFPNLEKEYVQKREEKTQSHVGVLGSCQTPTTQDANIGQEPTAEDILMEECQESPQKVTENIETLTKVSGQESSIEVEESESQDKELHGDIKVPAKVVQQESSSSVQEFKPLGLDSKDPMGSKTVPQQESAEKSLVPNLESFVPLEGKELEEKMAAVPEDSEVVKSSGTEMETPEAISPTETSLDTASDPNSEVSTISKESKDVKEVSTVHDSKLAESSKIETSDATSTESGDKVSVAKSQLLAALEVKESMEKMDARTVSEGSKVENSETTATESSSVTVSMQNSECLGVLEVKKPADKMKDGTVLEDSDMTSSEKVMETSESTTTESTSEKVSVPNSESSSVPEMKKLADKMGDETFSEHSEVSGTDLETSGTTLRGKRKADSISENDPNEKRTKKTSVEQ